MSIRSVLISAYSRASGASSTQWGGGPSPQALNFFKSLFLFIPRRDGYNNPHQIRISNTTFQFTTPWLTRHLRCVTINKPFFWIIPYQMTSFAGG